MKTKKTKNIFFLTQNTGRIGRHFLEFSLPFSSPLSWVKRVDVSNFKYGKVKRVERFNSVAYENAAYQNVPFHFMRFRSVLFHSILHPWI